MYKIRLYLITTLLLSLTLPILSPIHAVSDDEVTENLKKRLQDTVTSSPVPTNTYRSLVGVIRDVIKDTLVLEDKDGEKSIRIASGSALLRSPGNVTIKLEDIRLEDYAIAIGKFIGNDELESIRLIVSTSPLNNSAKVSGLATITKLGKNTITLTPLGGGEVKNLTISTKTVIKSPLAESLDFSSLVIGDSILYTGTLEKDMIQATNLMRVGFAAEPTSSPSN